jgi:CBS domain-containing protein
MLACVGYCAWVLGDAVQETVTDLMGEKAVTVGRSATVVEAALKMLEHNVHELPVIGENGDALGIVRAEDLLSATESTISDRIKPARLTVPHDISSFEAVQRMNESGSLYAVIKNGDRFVGLITWQDVLSVFKGH